MSKNICNENVLCKKQTRAWTKVIINEKVGDLFSLFVRMYVS